MDHRKSIVIAVTGGMGCGQTTVCKFLQKMGVKVINADIAAKKEVDSNPELKKELKLGFGSKIFFRNGKLNRKLLARIAFDDEAKTHRLNSIVHPHMVARILEEVEEARETGKYKIIAIDAALIYELSLEHMFDAIVVVTSQLKLRIDRIKERDHLSEKEIIDRINKQLPIRDKMKWADFVIQNNKDLEYLEAKTAALYNDLTKLARKKAG